MYPRTYSLNWEGAYISTGFCGGSLERFITFVSIKIVTGNYWIKFNRVFVSAAFENISNLSLKGTDIQHMQLMNKAINFTFQGKSLATLYDWFLVKYE